MIDADANDVTNSSVKSMPDLYLSEKLHVPRPTSTDLILQSDDKPECLTMSIVKGSMGFGFTIADSAYGQKVRVMIQLSKHSANIAYWTYFHRLVQYSSIDLRVKEKIFLVQEVSRKWNVVFYK